MLALLNTASGPRVTHDHPPPNRADEALIRMVQGGICATDLEIVQGYMGHTGVLGHEWVGIVERAPDTQWVGQRVVADINCPCGTCATCTAGRPKHCPSRTVLGISGRDGAFAEWLQLPVGNLHPVPDNVTDDQAIFVEPLAAACEITEQIHIRPSDRVAVLGTGRLGQLCARVLALTGADVYGVSRGPQRLTLLPENIRRVLAADASELAPFDIVVDCTGSPSGLGLATSLVRPRGTIVLKTTIHGQTPHTPTPWVIDEIHVVGSRCGPFAPALRLLSAGVIDPTPLITDRFSLANGIEALEAAAKPENTKVVLIP